MKNIALLLILISVLRVQAQSYNQQQRGLFVYSALQGGLVGGIGRVINKNPHEKRSKAFKQGFLRGVMGGLLTYSGKRVLYQIPKQHNYIYAWPAKLIHCTGSSIIYNAASNKGFFETWSTDIGFLYFRYDLKNRIFTPKIEPLSLAAFCYSNTKGKFDPRKSLQLGTAYFRQYSYDVASANLGNISINHHRYKETTLYDNYTQDTYFNQYRTTAHELTHNFQRFEGLNLDLLLAPIDKKLKNTYGSYYYLSKYIYLDLDIIHRSSYSSFKEYQKKDDKTYGSNFFEYEAMSFSRAKYVETK